MPERQKQSIPSPRIKRVIELLNKHSQELGRALTVTEAHEFLLSLEGFANARRDFVLNIVRRYALPSVFVKQGVKNDPRYKDLLRRIDDAVQRAQKSHGAAFGDVIAKMLSLSEPQLQKWLHNRGLKLEDVGILSNSQRLELLYLSVGEIFQRQDLAFQSEALASILHETIANVNIFLQRHTEIRSELVRMGYIE